jgi:hypothetical protein
MADLILALLREIDDDTSITVQGDNFDTTHPLVNAVIYLSNQYLTSDERHLYIRVLKQSDFDVFPGEQDRFGWLTGCIQLKRGMIVFG